MGAAGAVHDSMVLKFTQSGKFLMQIGKPNQSKGSNDVENCKLPAKMLVDPKTNELYVADGYGNRRVIVLRRGYRQVQAALGRLRPQARRHATPALQSRRPARAAVPQRRCTALALANDGLLYVCDRINDRIQVFKTGRHVREGGHHREEHPGRRRRHSTSRCRRDPQQKYIYLADGSNMKIHVLLRDTLEVLTTFGDGGRQPGQFYAVHSIATDSKGNIYTTETYRGQRVQKFLFKGWRRGEEGPGRGLAKVQGVTATQ